MAVDPRKRQKKLERRKGKQKAERRTLARRESQGLPARLQQASAAPILHCCANSAIWREGIGQLLVSRLLPNGHVAFAVFLVDMYCLGVKDAFTNIVPRGRYDRDLYGKLADQGALIKMQPECAYKLLKSAVEYANELGLRPHPDYRTAKLIFGDVAVEACDEEYTFGKDGKPFFIAGPHDSQAKCQEVIRTLHHSCGPEGFHFLLPVEGAMSARHVPRPQLPP